MDLTIEAIEEDFVRAERAAFPHQATMHATKALVRATLMAAGYGQPQVDAVPEPALAPADVSFTDLVDAVEVTPDDEDEDIWADVERERKR